MPTTKHAWVTVTPSIHGGVAARTIAFLIENRVGHNAKVTSTLVTIAVRRKEAVRQLPAFESLTTRTADIK